MTLGEAYNYGKEVLHEAKIENFAFDAMCIFQNCFGKNRLDLVYCRTETADEKLLNKFKSDIDKRKMRYPLQYILGKWSFMGLDFLVGEGVLIPRDDTEVLVETSLSLIKNIKNPKIIDLCAGSGAVSISLAKARPDAEVTAIELSDVAFEYLQKNITMNKVQNVEAVKGDILKDFVLFSQNKFDLIVSNPPYIKSEEIVNLQTEVKIEPRIALDGGKDGLLFYKAILSNWTKLLKSDRYICMEIGFDQGEDLKNLLKHYNYSEVNIVLDINNLDRVVYGKNKIKRSVKN